MVWEAYINSTNGEHWLASQLASNGNTNTVNVENIQIHTQIIRKFKWRRMNWRFSLALIHSLTLCFGVLTYNLMRIIANAFKLTVYIRFDIPRGFYVRVRPFHWVWQRRRRWWGARKHESTANGRENRLNTRHRQNKNGNIIPPQIIFAYQYEHQHR